jgi:cyclopropane fatty-acyl-phospholipid synthase-like methyltransferase
MDYKLLDHCLACNGTNLEKYLDLGSQPLANSFRPKGIELPSYPLAVNLCTDCFHTQLTVGVAPELLFRNYLYVSGTTKTLTEYFKNFVLKVENRFGGRKLRVLEIASNDGSLLEQFRLRGHSVQGIDPAKNLQPLSEKKGVPTIPEFWSPELAKSLTEKYDVIIAMNVFAHIQNPFGFLEAFKCVLDKDGAIFIQTSQAEMFRRFEFDTIYHEHHSFFTMKSFATLAKRSGLSILHAEKVPVHGTSYLWTLGFPNQTADSSPAKLFEEEEKDSFYKRETYRNFAAGSKKLIDEVNQRIGHYKDIGYSIVGYGAAAKGNTFLNFAKIDLEYIVDDNPLKVGLLSPGRDIEVVPPQTLNKIPKKMLLVVLAWNFFDEITERVRAVREVEGDISLTYFPAVRERPVMSAKR